MPLTAEGLFRSAGLETAGRVLWGTPPHAAGPGVYIVSISLDLRKNRQLDRAPVEVSAIGDWLFRRPELRLDGRHPAAEELAEHMARWWLPDEDILYIGKATSLRKRVAQYYRTPLGAAQPHKGGYWLKILSILPELTVHYSQTPDAKTAGDAEDFLIAEFLRLAATPVEHPEPALPLPFANLKIDRPVRCLRGHGVVGAYPTKPTPISSEESE